MPNFTLQLALHALAQLPWEDGAAAANPLAKRFGGNSEAVLLSGIVGHNMCIPRFGGPRTVDGKQETQPIHGEAGVLPWTLAEQGDDFVRFSIDLPNSQLSVSRTFSLAGAKAKVGTTVIPSDGKPKSIEWAEHVTIGDPFLDGATVVTDVDGAWLFNEPLGPASRFPDVAPLGAVPVDAALAMPSSADPPCGDVIAARVRGPGRFAVTNLGRTLS
jgi:hypothetical protein